MKKLIVILALTLLLISSGICLAATNVSFRWDANTEADLEGYRIYRSTSSGTGYVLKGTVLAPATEFTDLNIPDGTYFWVATAFDTNGNESGYSNELTASLDSTAPVPPQHFTIWQKIIAWLRQLFDFKFLRLA